MTQTEWIISLDDDLKDHDELFVGNVRDGDVLIRCKDCKYHLQTERNGFVYWSQCNHPHWDLSQGCQLAEVDDTDFCSWAERKEK